MKLVHVIIGLNGGGAEHFLYRLTCQQLKMQKTVMIISLTDLGVLGSQFIAAGAEVQCLNMSNISSIPKALLKFRRIINSIKPAIVQSWMYHADFLSSIVLLGMKQKLIWTVRCSIVPEGSRFTFLIMKLCAMISHLLPSKIVYVANAARINHQKYGYTVRNGDVIHNGYDFSSFLFSHDKRLKYRALLGISHDTLLLGMVGRFHKDKGHDLLLEALKFVKAKRSGFKLLLIGRGCSTDNHFLSDLLRASGLQDDVLLVGEQHDISGWLSAVDIYVMSSRTEGFPNALAEAMALGLPCIATDVGDAKVLAGKHALFCEPSSPSLASTILTAVDLSMTELKAMGSSGGNHVKESFSIEEIEKTYQDLYLSVLE